MDRVEAAHALHAFEVSEGLLKTKIDGRVPWQLVRALVFYRMADLPLSRPVGRGSKLIFYNALLSSLSLLRASLSAKRFGCVFVRMSSDYYDQAGVSKNYILDSLIQSCPEHFIVEKINAWSKMVRQRKYAIPYHLSFDFFELASYPFLLFYRNKKINDFTSHLSVRLQAELDVEIDPRLLSRVICGVYIKARVLSIFFRAVAPSLVIIANTGEYALLLACKMIGLRCLEIQHGIINMYHPDIIPAVEGVSPTDLLLPDDMALFGDYWIDQLNESILIKESMHAVGRELIDYCRERPRLIYEDYWNYSVLVTSQGLDTECLVDWIRRFVLHIPGAYRVLVNIKLHPIYDICVEKFSDLKEFENIRLIPASAEPSTLDVLASSDFHVSISSACHYDSLGLGKPTFILPLKGSEWILNLVDNRTVFSPSSPADLWRMMLSYRSGVINSDFYYRPGAVENLRTLVETLSSSLGSRG
ncbi:hypothetical protein N8Z80_03030 [Litorivicinus sp.]|nr:hypothetical protein [Litorivicinus sp.]MDC1239992.1 hypothetical protein [Litorivicinus sp.]